MSSEEGFGSMLVFFSFLTFFFSKSKIPHWHGNETLTEKLGIWLL